MHQTSAGPGPGLNRIADAMAYWPTMRRWTGPTCTLCAGLLVSGLPAQAADETARRPTFVLVESAAGAPIAGAIVTFVGMPARSSGAAYAADRCEVMTDVRGRAQAKLQPGLCYAAWAVAPEAAPRWCAASPVHGWFAAGALLTLQCGPPALATALRVDGEEAWRHVGPLQFVAWTPAPGIERPIARDDDGSLVLPAGPVQCIEVRTAAGEPLWHGFPRGAVLRLPPPQRLPVRVGDENGKPVAGARIRHRVGRVDPWRLDRFGGVPADRWRDLGVTDADGAAAVEVPYAADPLREPGHGPLLLFASVAGWPAVAGGPFQNGLLVDDRRPQHREFDELPFTLRRAEPLRGSLGRVPAGTTVHLAVVCRLYTDTNSYVHDSRVFAAAVRDDGAFVFDDVPDAVHSCWLSVDLPAGSDVRAPHFVARSTRELPPEVAAGGTDVLRGEGWTDLSLRWLEVDGGPARGLVGIAVPADGARATVRDAAVRVPLDARGGALLRLPPGRWVLAAQSTKGYGAHLLTFAAGEQKATLSMMPFPQMRLELRGADGEPIAGAAPVARGTTMRGTVDPVQTVLQSLSHRAEAWAALRTGADGRLAIPFVPVEGMTQRLGLVWDGGKTADFVLSANDDWEPLRPQ
jgi:hypothetical protein